MRWFSVAFLTNGIFIVTGVGFECIAVVLLVRTLDQDTTTPPKLCIKRDFTFSSFDHKRDSDLAALSKCLAAARSQLTIANAPWFQHVMIPLQWLEKT